MLIGKYFHRDKDGYAEASDAYEWGLIPETRNGLMDTLDARYPGALNQYTCRLWNKDLRIWSSKTFPVSDYVFQPIPYTEIPADVIEQWTCIPFGKIVLGYEHGDLFVNSVHPLGSTEHVLRIVNGCHLRGYSIYYHTDVLCYNGEDDSYRWQRSQQSRIMYNMISNRDPQFTEGQLIKIMEANLNYDNRSL